MGLSLWREAVTTYDEDDMPNVVRLELPRSSQQQGAAWMYIPHKDTIYIGPEGSYHIDVSHSLRDLLDVPKGEKIITGVMYDDGYADYFQTPEDIDAGRILSALQNYYETYYSGDFLRAEDDAGMWGNEQHMNYPHEDDEDHDPKRDLGKDHVDPNDIIPDYDSMGAAPAWFTDRDYSGNTPSGPLKMKDSPGQPYPISQWSVQDYLDWRDKKHWHGGDHWGSPREDYPHFRWSFGDNTLVKGAPHQGLWLWPTQNGYPDHFSQTGGAGLGNCSQGRVYAHQGDKWEILTWPERPSHVNDPLIVDAIQAEAQAAVRNYLIEKMNVDPKKIYFTKLHYGEAVTWYNSPSYPQKDYGSSSSWDNYTPKKYITEYQDGPVDWHSLKDKTKTETNDLKFKSPEGTEYNLSQLAPDAGYEDHVRLYGYDSVPAGKNVVHIDPNNPEPGWLMGERKEAPETPKESPQPPDQKRLVYDDTDGSSSYDVGDYGGHTNKEGDEFVSPGYNYQSKPLEPNTPEIQHTNPNGTISKIIQNYVITYDPNGKTTYKSLTPEEKYTLRIQWHEEDLDREDQKTVTPTTQLGISQQEIEDTAREMYPQYFQDTPKTSVKDNLVSYTAPTSGQLIRVSPEDYELTYRLHGDNWWKSFIPGRNDVEDGE